MECYEELARFLEGRDSFLDSISISLDKAIDACCSGKRVLASIKKFDSVTPVMRIVVEDRDYHHLLLDALAIFKEWLEKAGFANLAYFVVADDYAEVRLHEECFGSCSTEVASRIASYLMKAVDSKLRKLFIACKAKMKAINLAAIEGAKALIPAPRCGAKYLVPSDIDRFLDPSEVEHNSNWVSRYSCDRASELLARCSAIKVVDRVEVSPKAIVPKTFGRFEVMALLQAARYYLLTGDMDKAKSFGLNRAIFYAWAKYYGPRGRAWISAKLASEGMLRAKGLEKVKPLEDEVPTSPRGWFEMDGKEQLPEDFDRQVATKIEASIPMVVAWRRALSYVRKFPEEVLRDPNKFFKHVYEPVRDSFVERVIASPAQLQSSLHIERTAKLKARSGGGKPPVRTLTEFAKRDKAE